VATRLIGVPIELVIETMRPLAIERLSGAPEFVSGLSVIRGMPMPVVDVGRLLGSTEAPPRRFVTVRAGHRTLALAVSDVAGVRTLQADSLHTLPPLLRHAAAGIVPAVGALDAELLLVLQNAHIVPEEVWRRTAEMVSS